MTSLPRNGGTHSPAPRGVDGFSLHSICPRLARARDQLLALREAQHRRRIWIADERLKLERLVAHRELQLLRAGQTNDSRYIKRRQDKLDRAREDLRRLEHDDRHLEAA